jgi:hypothetical protein
VAERRRGGLARLPDFGASAEDRLLGSSVAPAEERQPSRRRPLKVDESLADQLRNAVLFSSLPPSGDGQERDDKGCQHWSQR